MRGPNERYSFISQHREVVVENCWRVTLHRGVPIVFGKDTTSSPPGIDHGSIVWEPQNCFASLENKALFTQGMYQEMRYFLDCILDGQQPGTGSLEFALHLMRVYEAALLSDGKAIRLR